MERYAEVFDTVEVNATFYRLPKEKTVHDWTEQVPGDFRFAVKASRYLTTCSPPHSISCRAPSIASSSATRVGSRGRSGRGGNYSEAELDERRRRIAAWRAHRPVYVYLNNDWQGFAPANARYLREGLS